MKSLHIARFIVIILCSLLFGCFTTGGKKNIMKFHKKINKVTKDDFKIYNSKGSITNFNDMVNAIKETEVVFIGEQHDDLAAHFVQLEVLKAMFNYYDKTGNNDNVVLSMEMFEKDVQIIIDEYLGDIIKERHFMQCARTWPNYHFSYRPLIEFARENHIKVIAANAPRRYVNRVASYGKESLKDLSPEAKSWIAPIPYKKASFEYKKKFEKFQKQVESHKVTGHPKIKNSKMPKRNMPLLDHLLEAQSLWDASMAFSIAQELKANPNSHVINLNGNFHSELKMGIPEHLLYYRPETSIIVITIIPSKNFPEYDINYEGYGDYIIFTRKQT